MLSSETAMSAATSCSQLACCFSAVQNASRSCGCRAVPFSLSLPSCSATLRLLTLCEPALSMSPLYLSCRANGTSPCWCTRQETGVSGIVLKEWIETWAATCSAAATSACAAGASGVLTTMGTPVSPPVRSEEHTSELQSRENLVCRLLLEKNKQG